VPEQADAPADQAPRPRRLRRSLPWLVHLLLLAGAAVLLAVAVRGQWFFGDEWAFIQGRDLGRDPVAALLEPHNEHLSVLPVLVYRALLAQVGLHTYWPYIAVVLALHLLLAHLLWHVMRRSGARVVTATALATLAALLGAGGENLLWAFQMGFVGSVTAGVGALLLADHDGRLGLRDAGAVLLCLVSLGCSGVGVSMVAAVGLGVLLRRRSWLQAAAVVAWPAALLVCWYVTFGRGATSGAETAPPLPPLGLGAVPRFAFDGLSNALEAGTGLRGAGAVLLLALVALLVRRPGLLSGRGAAAVACAGGAVAFFVLTGISRVALGVEQARVSRYVYVGMLLLLPLLALGLDVLLDRLQHPAVVVVPLAACLVAVNLAVLYSAADRTRVREQGIRGTVLAAADLVRRDEPILARKPDPEFSRDLSVAGLALFLERGWLPEPGRLPDLERTTARARLQVDLRAPRPPRASCWSRGSAPCWSRRARLRARPAGRRRAAGGRPGRRARRLAAGAARRHRTAVGAAADRRRQPERSPRALPGRGTPQSLVTATGGRVLLTLPEDGAFELCAGVPPGLILHRIRTRGCPSRACAVATLADRPAAGRRPRREASR
jgi:hypothetical protein